MAANAQQVAAFEAELARLSAEVTRLAGIREALDRYTSNQAAAHYLIEMGRQMERAAQATRRVKPGPRRRRPEYLRPAGGGDAS
jgi:hypothetical protein